MLWNENLHVSTAGCGFEGGQCFIHRNCYLFQKACENREMITMTSNSTFPGPSPDVPTVQPDIGIPYYVGETILAFCAFLSNSLVILLFSLERKLRVTVSNVHLISLAISDFCMGTVAIPILLVTLQGYPHEFPACITLLSLVVLIAIASVFALLTMTLDRYYSITHPLQYSVKVTKTRASFTALLAWLFACLLVLPMPLGWHHKPSQPQCFFTEVVSMQYMTFIFFVCILTPFVVMCTVYIRLYVIIQKQVCTPNLKQLQAIHDTCQRLQGLSAGEDTSIVVQTGQQFHLDRIDEGGATSQTPPTVSHLDNFHRIKREIKTAAHVFLKNFENGNLEKVPSSHPAQEISTRQVEVNNILFYQTSPNKLGLIVFISFSSCYLLTSYLQYSDHM
ncbi:adenosine receptor A2b-like [Acanthaster planci]|uniref:Adenosine receptor A2b-like n=1 Tax=Acanthaster planci TaxID=133434 RepID=A0A8B7Z4P9_ACAPL|nr:adenosine receptor A2b-like [Acanthaster planci]